MNNRLSLLILGFFLLLTCCQCFSTNVIWRTYILTNTDEEYEISCNESPPESDLPDSDELELLYPTVRRHFNFYAASTFTSKEVMIRQTSFGCGKLGHQVWPSSVALSLFLCGYYEFKIRGQSVLELGAGCGLPSAVCRDVLGAKSVMATDFWMSHDSYDIDKDRLIPESWHGTNLEFNMLSAMTGSDGDQAVSVQQLDWHDPDSVLQAVKMAKPSIVIGSDLVYYPMDVGPLWQTVEICLNNGVQEVLFFLPLEPDMRESMPEFQQLLESKMSQVQIQTEIFKMHRDAVGGDGYKDLFLKVSIGVYQ